MVHHCCRQELGCDAFVYPSDGKATYGNAKTLVYLHGYSAIAVARVPLFYVDDELDHFWRRSFSTWLLVTFVGIQELVLSFHQSFVKFK